MIGEQIFSRRAEETAVLHLYDNGSACDEAYQGCHFADDTTRCDGTFTRDSQRYRLQFEGMAGDRIEIEGELLGDVLTLPGKTIFAGEWKLNPFSRR